jgi:hypothetical protein
VPGEAERVPEDVMNLSPGGAPLATEAIVPSPTADGSRSRFGRIRYGIYARVACKGAATRDDYS